MLDPKWTVRPYNNNHWQIKPAARAKRSRTAYMTNTGVRSRADLARKHNKHVTPNKTAPGAGRSRTAYTIISHSKQKKKNRLPEPTNKKFFLNKEQAPRAKRSRTAYTKYVVLNKTRLPEPNGPGPYIKQFVPKRKPAPEPSGPGPHILNTWF